MPSQEHPPQQPWWLWGTLAHCFGKAGAALGGLHRTPGALAVKAPSVEKNIPNSSPSHCLYLQGADGSLQGERELCRKPGNPWCAWESSFIHHRELSRGRKGQRNLDRTGCSGVTDAKLWAGGDGSSPSVPPQTLEETGPASIRNSGEGQCPSHLPLVAAAVKTNHQPLLLCPFFVPFQFNPCLC